MSTSEKTTHTDTFRPRPWICTQRAANTTLILSVLIITIGILTAGISGCAKTPYDPASPRLKNTIYGKWQKQNDPTFILEVSYENFMWTEKGNFNSASFNIANNEIKPKISRSSSWSRPSLKYEVFANGEMILSNAGGHTEASIFEGRFVRPNDSTTIAGASKLQPLKVKLDQCIGQQNRLEDVYQKLAFDKSKIVEKLKRLGVKTSADLKSEETHTLARELTEIATQLAAVEKKQTNISATRSQIESVIRRAERASLVDGATGFQEDVEKQIQEVTELKIELDDRPSTRAAILQDSTIEKILAEQLQ